MTRIGCQSARTFGQTLRRLVSSCLQTQTAFAKHVRLWTVSQRLLNDFKSPHSRASSDQDESKLYTVIYLRLLWSRAFRRAWSPA
jgi:hypothetical protein